MSLKTNVIANYLGQGWVAVMGIAFVPLYVRVLGMESYGLIGVFAVLQAWMTLLDLGLTPTINREMARLRAGLHTPQSVRDLLRTLETVYGVLALGMIGTVFVIAPYLAGAWLKVDSLPLALVVGSLRIMGFVLATRWLEQVYRSALQGIQDLVWLNTAQAVLATLRWGGAFLVIKLVSPTVTAFFVWQGLVSLLTAGILAARAYRTLPRSTRPARFNVAAIRDIRAFAAGMFFSSILSLLLTQSDKIVISKMLPLKELGYYMLASVVVGGLLQLVTPMNTAVYPRLTEQVARQDYEGLAKTYQISCQWMSAIIVPPGLVLAFFSGPVLFLWTGDKVLSHSVTPLLAVLAAGTLCNGLMNLPYMLQLAYGWTGLAVGVNSAAVVLVVPAIAWAVPRYGVIGAAAAWLVLNAAYLVVVANLMHRRILPQEKWLWYRNSIFLPLASGSAAAIVLSLVLPSPSSRVSAGLVIIVVTIVLAITVSSVIPGVRDAALRALGTSNPH